MQKYVLLSLSLVINLTICKAENLTIYDIVPGVEYYILNNYYNRPLGSNLEGTGAYLIANDKAQENRMVWVAEVGNSDGYIKLKNKFSNAYLSASTTNSYSVLLTKTSGTENVYDWMVRPGTNGSLVNRKSKDKALGVDTNEQEKEFIGVWYDKGYGNERCIFTVVPNDGNGLESSIRNWAVTDLRNIISLVRSECDNTRNPLNYRTRLRKSADEAEAMIENNRSNDILQQKAQNMRDSLATMVSTNETQVILTQSDMNSFANTFSIGLSNLTLDQTKFPNDSVCYIIRGKDGRGSKIVIRENGDYVIIKEGTKIHVYQNGQLKEELPAVYLPKITNQDTEAEVTLIRKSRLAGVQTEILSENSVVTECGKEVVNKYGNLTRTVVNLSNANLVLDHPVDFHILSETNAISSGSINLTDEHAWLIFDNALPSNVKDNYLKYIKINGKSAVLDTNCRIVIYLNGALVMPFADKGIFTGYEGEQYSGKAMSYGLGNIGNLNKNANRIRSFRLKRGYMVTLASDPNGKGYSRVYVADHNDIEVPVLPNALYARISSLNVRKWQYVSKKGWCSTTGQSANEAECRKVRATWFYTWSADRSSSIDHEYIPIKQHIYWPGNNDIDWRTGSTAVLGYNEPDHSEQHNNCDCKGAIDPWKAYTHASEFLTSGLRIGSPAPTDASWLTEYIGHCNDMQTRCDFVAIHCYWGPNEAANADAWKSRLQDIYNKTKRPIWITEWNYGASWTSEGWPSGWSDKLEKERAAIKSIQSMLESLPFVERYAIYNWDTDYRTMIQWDNGSVTPAGKVYRDMKSDFAYNASVQFTPVWWAPSKQTPQLTVKINEADETLAISVKNDNRDLTDIFAIQVRHAGSEWEDYYREEDRSLFDNNVLEYSFPLKDFNTETDELRIYVRRTQGEDIYSLPASMGYIINPSIVAKSKSEIEGWTCSRDAANGYTKHDSGDTYFEVWSPDAKGIHFNYYQDITDLPSGIYQLSGTAFNSTDNIADAVVNGSVLLYAQADSVMYFSQVTKDSQIEGASQLVIPGIIVRNGTIRLGIRNIGTMMARWAGGDNFRLTRTAHLPADADKTYYDTRNAQQVALAEAFVKFTDEAHTEGDASAFVVNPDCYRKTNYAWKVTNAEMASDKAYDGVIGNAYWNLWKSSPFKATMDQDIDYLPEGEYSLKALVRGSANENITLTATVMRNGEEKVSEEKTSASVTLTGKGEGEVAGSGYKNGWFMAKTPFVVVRPGDTLHLSLTAEAASGSCWWSADHFGLDWRYINPLVDKIDMVNENMRTFSKVYDLMGRPASTRSHGVYIVNGKKIIR